MYWESEDTWYSARIMEVNPESVKPFRVLYDDDNKAEWMALEKNPAIVDAQIVWAKMKGHAWWPARVSPGSSCALHPVVLSAAVAGTSVERKGVRVCVRVCACVMHVCVVAVSCCRVVGADAMVHAAV